MYNKIVMLEAEHQHINFLEEEFNARGGMSTEELKNRLNAVPFEEFQKGLKEKIQNYII